MGQSPRTHDRTRGRGPGHGHTCQAGVGGGWPGVRTDTLSPCRFGDDIPGMEGLGTGTGVLAPLCHGWGMGLAVCTAICSWAGGVGHADAASLLSPDITVICPWEAFSHLELHELAQYGII